MAKTLVAYLSASGTTEKLARRLAKEAGADLFEIVPEQPYTSADLDWTNKRSRSTLEMQDASSRPAVASRVADMASYDTVFVGFPIWWYVAPTIVNAFLEAYDPSGKTIIPFATSGGSAMGKTVEALAPSAPGANVLPGKVLNGASDAAIREFAAQTK